MDTLQFKIEENPNNTYIKFTGDIMGTDAFDLKQELKKYAIRDKDLKIDLTEVNEISLTGLNSILISKAYANSQDNKVTLVVKEDSKILNHLQLTKMTDQFTIELEAQKN